MQETITGPSKIASLPGDHSVVTYVPCLLLPYASRGYAIVWRPGRGYSTHHVYWHREAWYAEHGHYNLSGAAAWADLAQRAELPA